MRETSTKPFLSLASALAVVIATGAILKPLSRSAAWAQATQPATQPAVAAAANAWQEAAGPLAGNWKGTTIPEAFRVVVNNPMSSANVTYQYQVDGRDWRDLQLFRFHPDSGQPQAYHIWPVPQLVRNSRPVPGFPDWVFDPTEPDEFGSRDIRLKVELCSKEMRDFAPLIDTVWKLESQKPNGYLVKNGVMDKSQIVISTFPVTHGFVRFVIGRKDFLFAQTQTITATTSNVEIAVSLTPNQVRELDNAIKENTLRMIWRFQYSGTAPALKANENVLITAAMVAEAVDNLTAEQQSGELPVFDEKDRENVAQNLLSQLRISKTGNSPDALLLLTDIDALLPVIFKKVTIEGNELDQLLSDDAKKAALTQYLLPMIKKIEQEEVRSNQSTATSQHTQSSGEGDGSTFVCPILGLGMGHDTSWSEQRVKSLTENSGVTFAKKQGTSEYMPVKIETYAIKNLKGFKEQAISNEVYVTKDANGRYYYVEDSEVSVGSVSIYDVLRTNAKSVEDQFRQRRVEHLHDLLLRERDAKWKANADEVNKKWSDGITVTLKPYEVPEQATKRSFQLAPGTPEFRLSVNETHSQRLKISMSPSVFVLADTSEKDYKSKLLFRDENGAPAWPGLRNLYGQDGAYWTQILFATYGNSGKKDPKLELITYSFSLRDFRFDVRDVALPDIQFVRWVPSGVGDFVAEATAKGDFQFRICGANPEQLLDPAKPSEAWLKEIPAPGDTATLAQLTDEQLEQQIRELEGKLEPATPGATTSP